MKFIKKSKKRELELNERIDIIEKAFLISHQFNVFLKSELKNSGYEKKELLEKNKELEKTIKEMKKKSDNTSSEKNTKTKKNKDVSDKKTKKSSKKSEK